MKTLFFFAVVAAVVALQHEESIVPVAVPVAIPVQPDADAKLVQLIKEREGFHSRPYRCPAGTWTIGYGFTAQKYIKRKTMTEKEATEILVREIIPTEKKRVRSIVRVPLLPYQEAALVSFCFNCGESNLRKLVSGKNRLNGGNYERTPSLLLQYVKVGNKTLRGLVERRKAEAKLFQSQI